MLLYYFVKSNDGELHTGPLTALNPAYGSNTSQDDRPEAVLGAWLHYLCARIQIPSEVDNDDSLYNDSGTLLPDGRDDEPWRG